MDNGEFLGQLAQFSTVNGISSLNTSFAGLADRCRTTRRCRRRALVGQSLCWPCPIPASSRMVGSAMAAVELTSSAGNVQIDITDEAGELVQRYQLGQQGRALSSSSGTAPTMVVNASPGDYKSSARHAWRRPKVESTTTVIEALRIQSVTLGQFGGGMTLNLVGWQEMPLGAGLPDLSDKDYTASKPLRNRRTRYAICNRT